MNAPDARNVFGWVMVGGALVVAFVAGVVLAARWPLPALVVASHSAVALVVWLATDRGLREQNAGLTERHDAWNRQAASTDLAEVGPVTPPRGEPEPIEVEPFMADSGYRAPAEVEHLGQACQRIVSVLGHVCGRPAVGWITMATPLDDRPVWFCAEHYAQHMEGAGQ